MKTVQIQHIRTGVQYLDADLARRGEVSIVAFLPLQPLPLVWIKECSDAMKQEIHDDANRRLLASTKNDRIKYLFHFLWGLATENPGYNKKLWNELRGLLEEKGISL